MFVGILSSAVVSASSTSLLSWSVGPTGLPEVRALLAPAKGPLLPTFGIPVIWPSSGPSSLHARNAPRAPRGPWKWLSFVLRNGAYVSHLLPSMFSHTFRNSGFKSAATCQENALSRPQPHNAACAKFNAFLPSRPSFRAQGLKARNDTSAAQNFSEDTGPGPLKRLKQLRHLDSIQTPQRIEN